MNSIEDRRSYVTYPSNVSHVHESLRGFQHERIKWCKNDGNIVNTFGDIVCAINVSCTQKLQINDFIRLLSNTYFYYSSEWLSLFTLSISYAHISFSSVFFFPSHSTSSHAHWWDPACVSTTLLPYNRLACFSLVHSHERSVNGEYGRTLWKQCHTFYCYVVIVQCAILFWNQIASVVIHWIP